ncbi:HalOD1 output domain-containing protein [Halobaculum rarum]|uniref:HalOD1 output domain-containing protein n=1 Tax=Halobaculum rarum TaxID=3075122 RepID=UPI0032AF1C19
MTRTQVLEDARTDASEATDATPAESPVSAVVSAVATVDGVDPMDLNTTLQGAVDADALASLARHDGTDWRLEFSLGDHEVAVEGDGTVVVDGRVFQNRF